MSIVIPIISEFNSKGIERAKKEFQQLEGFSAKAGYAVKKAAIPAAGALSTLAVAAFKATQKASDLEEVQNKVGVIFGSSAKKVEAFAKTAATSLGQSTTQALNAAATFATFGKSAGIAGEELVDFSTDFVTLATDLSSFNNTSPEEAINAIGSALRGEAEPLRKFGVLLDDATLRQAALSLGLIKTTKEALTPQNKVLAAQKVIYEQTGSAQGDFIRTSGSMANQQKTLAASVENLTTQIGKAFLPIVKDAIPIINDYADIISGLVTQTDNADFQTNKWVNTFKTLNKYLNPAAPLLKGLQFFDGLIRGNSKALDQNQRVLSNTGTKVLANQIAFSKLRAETDKDTVATDRATAAKKKNADRLAKQKKAAEELAQALKEARDALTEQFSAALEKANSVLDDAKAKFDDFAKTVSATFTGALNFKDAYDAGLETGTGFLEGLTTQIAKIKKFGELTNRLIAGGLSEGALSKVLDAGVDAGTAIAEELLSGAGNILTANALVADAQAMADKVGLNAANSFYKAGVDAGTALVQGMQSVIDRYIPMMNAPGMTAAGVNALGTKFAAETSGADGGSALANMDWSSLLSGIKIDIGGLATLASGGLVTSPTIALIGEGGQPEAVVPLDRMGEMGGGSNVTINVNGGDPNAIVDALRRYMRVNGAVPIRTIGTA